MVATGRLEITYNHKVFNNKNLKTNIMNRKLSISLSIVILISIPIVRTNAQTSTQDIKPNEVYAQQIEYANKTANKPKIIPFDLPDAKSLVAINQSGDGVINIPLVNVKGRKLSLPISLTYVTSGIKVDQPSSEVGLGWSINIGSITRDYGAFEPDYSFTGKELTMPAQTGVSTDANKLYTNNGFINPFIDPWRENKSLSYNMCSGSAPDKYKMNVSGVESNEFWNYTQGNLDASGNALAPSFVFTKQVPWKLSYEVKTDTISQEISRINEFTYSEAVGAAEALVNDNTYAQGFNMAAAIGLFPYVKNGRCPEYVVPPAGSTGSLVPLSTTDPMYFSTNPKTVQVQYEDYSKFTITTADGTKYIFGRPLRGQKYLFDEEPFWSSMNLGTEGDPNKAYDELWKTDYIAEWLLTEIRSNDYVDANNDGVADDGDYGDWIAIQYTDQYQYEQPAATSNALPMPLHREFSNFTQTDMYSSLIRERAYVTKITTPIETVTFGNSNKFDIDFDYFNKVFNTQSTRIDASKPVADQNVPYAYNVYTTLYPYASFPAAPSGYSLDTQRYYYVKYPMELRRYDSLSVADNITSSHPLVQNITLNYAAQGAANQLAVSTYAILHNDGKTFNSYNPASLGAGLDQSNFAASDGYAQVRGKSTLLGIDYRGANSSSANKISYSFAYNNNPSYSNIHLYQIQKLGAFATVRECLSGSNVNSWGRWPGYKTLVGGTIIPNSILPWKSITVNSFVNSSTFTPPNNTNWNNKVMEDELGYYYDPTLNALNGRDAWSLTNITLPYGGKISLTYELDQTDINDDRNNWVKNGIADYCLPSVGHYNNVAHLRSIMQDEYNQANESTDTFANQLYPEYYFLMNQNTGGLRIKKVDISDIYSAPTITKTYAYGTGHYTLPPADYWGNYMQGFSEFIENEKEKHVIKDLYAINTTPLDYNDYTATMTEMITSTRLDDNINELSTHYYEYIDEISSDGSKIRSYYGQMLNNATNPTPGIVYYPTYNGLLKQQFLHHYDFVELLATDLDHSKDIGNYATFYFNAAGGIVKKVQSDYEFIENKSFNIQAPVTQQIVDAEYALPEYHPYLHDIWGYIPGTNTCILPPTHAADNMLHIIPSEHFFNYATAWNTLGDIISGIGSSIGYGSISTQVNSTAEAVNPLLRLAYESGGLPSAFMPTWFAGIAAVNNPWLGSTPMSTIHSAYDATTITLVHDNSYSSQRDCNQHPELDIQTYLQMPKYSINPLTYKSHQSYILRPIHTTTTTNF